MKERVRAILLTTAGSMLVINRICPGIPPYQVLVGGGVEPEDADLEAALLREVHEEIAGEAVNLHPFRQLDPRLAPRPGWPARGGHGFLRSNPRRHPSPVT